LRFNEALGKAVDKYAEARTLRDLAVRVECERLAGLQSLALGTIPPDMTENQSTSEGETDVNERAMGDGVPGGVANADDTRQRDGDAHVGPQ
jgi:hypothetical protein